MKYFKLVFKVFIAICVFFSNVYCEENVRAITVTGESKSVVQADYAKINLRIERVENEMKISYDKVVKTFVLIQKQMKSFGIKEDDFIKSFITQRKEYEWRKQVKQFKGYFSECFVEIKINDITKLNNVYETLAEFSDVSINRTTFGHSKENKLKNDEIKKALIMAKEKASILVKASDVVLGKIILIEEVSNIRQIFSRFTPRSRMELMASGESKSSPDFSGTIEITAKILVQYNIK